MRVLFVTAEIHPLVRTGGLADVSAALPAALAGLGVDVRVIVPGYPQALDRAVVADHAIPLGDLPDRFTARATSPSLTGVEP